MIDFNETLKKMADRLTIMVDLLDDANELFKKNLKEYGLLLKEYAEITEWTKRYEEYKND